MDNLVMLKISDMLRILDRAKDGATVETQQEIAKLKVSVILLHEETLRLKAENQELKQVVSQ